jgi:hypothetical protein
MKQLSPGVVREDISKHFTLIQILKEEGRSCSGQKVLHEQSMRGVVMRLETPSVLRALGHERD